MTCYSPWTMAKTMGHTMRRYLGHKLHLANLAARKASQLADHGLEIDVDPFWMAEADPSDQDDLDVGDLAYYDDLASTSAPSSLRRSAARAPRMRSRASTSSSASGATSRASTRIRTRIATASVRAIMASGPGSSCGTRSIASTRSLCTTTEGRRPVRGSRRCTVENSRKRLRRLEFSDLTLAKIP